MLALSDNRISLSIASIQARLDELDAATVSKLDGDLAVEFDEHFAYQQAQARAHVEGVLTTEEAQLIYVALGEVGSPANGGWASDTTTATKVVVTKVVGELLGRRLGR